MCAIAKKIEMIFFGEETWDGDFVGAKHTLEVVFYVLPLTPIPAPSPLTPHPFFGFKLTLSTLQHNPICNFSNTRSCRNLKHDCCL
jgi:hypothetical protein